MVCPKEVNQDKLCRKCKYNKPDGFWDNGKLDNCIHPKVCGDVKDSSTCYITGKITNGKGNIGVSDFCNHLRFEFDDGWRGHIPGINICGKDGLWFEPKPEGRIKKLYRKIKRAKFW